MAGPEPGTEAFQKLLQQDARQQQAPVGRVLPEESAALVALTLEGRLTAVRDKHEWIVGLQLPEMRWGLSHIWRTGRTARTAQVRALRSARLFGFHV